MKREILYVLTFKNSLNVFFCSSLRCIILVNSCHTELHVCIINIKLYLAFERLIISQACLVASLSIRQPPYQMTTKPQLIILQSKSFTIRSHLKMQQYLFKIAQTVIAWLNFLWCCLGSYWFRVTISHYLDMRHMIFNELIDSFWQFNSAPLCQPKCKLLNWKTQTLVDPESE